MKPRVVLFDLDGTLIDSLPMTFTAFQDALEPFVGRRPPVAEILERFGPADQEIVADWVGAEHAADAVRLLYASYDRQLAGVKPFPGIPEILDALEGEGRRLGLVTGRGRPSTEVILAALGWTDRFAVTLTGDEIPNPKPAPDGLRVALERLGAAPADAVYVGDTDKDTRAARAAGIVAAAAAWGTPDDAALRAAGGEPCYTVADLRRFLGLA